MSSINSDEIISILKEEIENFDSVSKDSEVGTVVAVGDGIATIYGIDHAMYGEIVTFDTGLKGMVQDIQKNEIGVILFGRDTDIKEGTKVTRTGKKAGRAEMSAPQIDPGRGSGYSGLDTHPMYGWRQTWR